MRAGIAYDTIKCTDCKRRHRDKAEALKCCAKVKKTVQAAKAMEDLKHWVDSRR